MGMAFSAGVISVNKTDWVPALEGLTFQCI